MSNTAVDDEVKMAYADCHMGWEKGSKLRNLDFRASNPVSVEEAISIMTKWVPGYNGFYPQLLKYLPKNAKVTIAREGSVCIYVTGAKVTQKIATKMDADEFDSQGQSYRLWWD